MAKAERIVVEVSPGELIDKITILAIKTERITDPAMLQNVEHERSVLEAACKQAIVPSAELERATQALKEINTKLWNIEDEIRRCERAKDFGMRFIELARAVYHTNDQRAQVKRQINELLGSEIMEEKHYVPYDDTKEI